MMKKTFALLICLMLVIACWAPFAQAADATAYGSIGLEMTLPDGFEQAGLYVLYEANLMNIVYADAQNYAVVGLVMRLSAAEWAALQADTVMYADMQANHLREMPGLDGYTYLVFNAAEFDDVAAFYTGVMGQDFYAFSADGQAGIRAAMPLLKQAMDTMTAIPVSSQLSGRVTFSTTDLQGNPVTEAIFAGKDLTVINVWGTFCGPCINEMPELAAWDAALPDNVQIIGVVCDIYEGNDVSPARSIVDSTGVKFTNLLANDSLLPLLSMSQYVPTTYFVDSQGNFVGDPIVGADVQGYKNFVEGYLK